MVHLRDLQVYLQFPGGADQRVSRRAGEEGTLKGISVLFSPVSLDNSILLTVTSGLETTMKTSPISIPVCSQWWSNSALVEESYDTRSKIRVLNYTRTYQVRKKLIKPQKIQYGFD